MIQDLIKESKNKGFMSRDNLVQVNDDYYYLWMCELQKWLRDVHNIDVLLHMNMNNTYTAHIWKNNISINYNKDLLDVDWIMPVGSKYEEILEEGLFHALTLI